MRGFRQSCLCATLAIFYITLIQLIDLSESKGLREITCGSVFKLMNNAFKVRLHSHDIKYGSGSGQQSVTGTDIKEDVNSNWAVKGTAKLPCKRGTNPNYEYVHPIVVQDDKKCYANNNNEPVVCGTKLRLEHLQTGRNLHSHLFSSPLSGHQEISAFGENGEGDSGDVWEIVCKGDSWQRDESIQFKHVDTDAFLSASGNSYGRPISGQMEIVGLSHSDSSSYWTAMEGIFIHPTELGAGGNHPEHNEL